METNGTQRELGAFFQEVKELRHDYRSLRTSINILDESQRRLERDLFDLRAELRAFNSKVMALCASAVAVVTAGAWALDFWASL